MTGKVKDFVKRIEIKRKNHHFDGSDPIWIINLLRRFVNEAYTQLLSETQAYLALPDFLDGFALRNLKP